MVHRESKDLKGKQVILVRRGRKEKLALLALLEQMELMEYLLSGLVVLQMFLRML